MDCLYYDQTRDVEGGKQTWLVRNGHRFILGGILVFGLILRLTPFIDISGDGFRFLGTCGQLFEEAKPLFDANNPLHFEVFFYPPVPAVIVASTALLVQTIITVDFSHYCLLWNVGVSAATPLLIYFIGREWGIKAGLIAAAFYSATMIAVYSSDNIQMYPTFFAMLGILFFYKSLTEPSTVNLALIGLFLGLAVASKYFPALLFLMLFLVQMAKRREQTFDAFPHTWSRRYGFKTFNIAINAVILSALVFLASSFYLGFFQKPLLLSFFKGIYDGYPHGNDFEYHAATIERLYRLGLLSISGIGIVLGLLLFVLYQSRMSAAESIFTFYRSQRLWVLPVVAAGITILISIGIPAAVNLHNYIKYTTWIAKSYASADGGFFPGGRPAPSYLLSYFPENLGLPLFIVSVMGLGYCLYMKDRKAMLLFLISLPLYIALELSSVKVNRFAMDLMPVLCLFAAIGMVSVFERNKSVLVRSGIVLFACSVFIYSGLYSLAWGNLQRSLSEVPRETVSWITKNVPEGSRIGMKAQLWISGSPRLLPDPSSLASYQLDEYKNSPDIIVVPKMLHAIMQQYAELTRAGYVYRPEDWSPLPGPAPGETDILVDLVDKHHYDLIKEFERRPCILGVTFSAQALTGKTWFLEHTGSYGIQVYRKRGQAEQRTLNSLSVVPKESHYV